MTDDLMTLRDKIVEAALPHIPFDGWTPRAARRAAADLDLAQADAIRAFPYGAADMVAHYSDLVDRRMLAELDRRDIGTMKIRERIATAVRVRLEQAAPHREAVRRALAVLALPSNAILGGKCLYRTVDAMWVAAGDTSTDWNFYSKRSLLAGVYSSTLLCWLDDRSDGLTDTWAFLDRRIADVMRIPKLTGRVRSFVDRLPNPARLCRPGDRYSPRIGV
jgi:ubiquinone biosynthesis protein COQ9